MTNRTALSLALGATLASMIGCQHEDVQRINAQSFYTAKQLKPDTSDVNPLADVPRPKPVYGDIRPEPRVHDPLATTAPVDPPTASVTAKADARANGSENAEDQTISPAVRHVVREPEKALSEGYPPVAPTSPTSGEYMTIGGVVSEVNGTPIYANRVIRALETVLAAKAKELDPPQYAAAARALIQNQIGEFEQAELEFAAADRTLDENDKNLASQLTVMWTTQQITRAGGSREVAKKMYAADGKDFEEESKAYYRVTMRRIYYQRKIFPRLQVSADEMRHFYLKNVDNLFTEHGEAQFRLIKIDPRAVTGGRPAALDRARMLHDQALHGEDFGTLAERYNNDARLARNKGDVGVIQYGAFRLAKVEEAVWKLQPGQVSDIVEEADGSLYLAKMESRKNGKTLPFEDEKVQRQITLNLQETQMRDMRAKIRDNLLKNAVIRNDPEMMNSAIEMALQKYPAWSGRAEASTVTAP